MADTVIYVAKRGDSESDYVAVKLIDNGDGTYSLSQAGATGANADIGAKADSAATTDAGTFSLIALIKRLLGKILIGAQTLANSQAVNDTSATLYAGTFATSGSAAVIASTQAVREVMVQNDPDSTADMLIGNASAQTIQLKPGWSVVIPVADLATVYAKSVSGTPGGNYLGRS